MAGLHWFYEPNPPLSVEMMRSCKWFQHVGTMPTLAYNRENSAIIYNISNLCDREVVINLILVILKRDAGLNHYLHKDIIWHNNETIVNFEQKFNCRYTRYWQNTFQQGVDIFRRTFWKIRWEGSLKFLDVIL